MFQQVKKRNRFSRAGERQAVVCVSEGQHLRLWRMRRGNMWAHCLLVLWLSVYLVGCRGDGSAVVIQGTLSTAENSGEGDRTSGQENMVSTAAMADQTAGESAGSLTIIYVHVCGQVAAPGVYALTEGSRVWDAVEAAGGLTAEAQPEAVNLALVITDGSKVTIPTQTQAQETDFRWYETGIGDRSRADQAAGDESGQTGRDPLDSRVDLNRADVAALMTIPGIGEARAQAIVEYRQNRGPFGSIEEIMQVAGIKEGLFAKIRDYIIVGG